MKNNLLSSKVICVWGDILYSGAIICSAKMQVQSHISNSDQLLLVQAETLSETLNTNSPVTRLIARKIFIFYCPERWKSYIVYVYALTVLKQVCLNDEYR